MASTEKRKVVVHIEHCETFEYGTRYYQDLVMKIKSNYPETDVSGSVGRLGSFEVVINEQLVFSKLKSGGFPRAEDILEQVKNAIDGKPLQKVLVVNESCIIT